ncbi:ABC transporter permease [Lactobacillus sp. XV13L]|nr:ABC transporter permease [Lactobacillus sp. XV13L]
MQIKQIISVVKLNGRLQLAEPIVQIIMILVPLIMAPFMIPGAKTQLFAQGYLHANGSEQVVPGLAVLFSFLSVQFVIQMFFDETTWNTWDRLQVSATSLTDIIIGKAIVAYFVQLVQLTAVLLISSWVFNFHPNGSLSALIAIILSFALTLTFMGIALTSWVKSANIALSLSNLLGILMAGWAGSLSPISSFPHWACTLAKVDPAYWALAAFKKTVLNHGNFNSISNNLVVIWCCTLLFCFLAFTGFHHHSLNKGNN